MVELWWGTAGDIRAAFGNQTPLGCEFLQFRRTAESGRKWNVRYRVKSVKICLSRILCAHFRDKLVFAKRFQPSHFSSRLRNEKADIVPSMSQSDGGALHLLCKTSATLSAGPKAPLTKTLGQLVGWIADAKAAGGIPDPTRDAAVLAVHVNAARTLDDLESSCRAFDLGGAWAKTRSQRNQAEKAALGTFETITTMAWTAHSGAAVDADLAEMARRFHIARFSMDEGGSDWRETSRLLGRC
jgi:hypothetical protein